MSAAKAGAEKANAATVAATDFKNRRFMGKSFSKSEK
jgi:hypothetical protein